MSKYQEIPRVVDAVKFGEQSYNQQPFRFENEEIPTKIPEWVQKLIDRDKLVAVWQKGSDCWMYTFTHDEVMVPIEPGSWLIYDQNRRNRINPEYQVLTSEEFAEKYQSPGPERYLFDSLERGK